MPTFKPTVGDFAAHLPAITRIGRWTGGRVVSLAFAAALYCMSGAASVVAQQPAIDAPPTEPHSSIFDRGESWDMQYGHLSDVELYGWSEHIGHTDHNRRIVADRGVAPAEYLQGDADGPMQQPSYMDAADGVTDSRPSYLEPDDDTMSIVDELDRLSQRIGELEAARVAQEDATRTLIRQSFAERGSNMTDAVVFGGTLEALTYWAEDFDGTTESDIILDTAELDFEIQVNDWVLGSLIFEYDDGRDLLFPTTEEDELPVDRINVDTAFITIGDTQNYPLFVTFGRVIVPFGISTGDPVADVLSIIDPLTVEVFETKQDVIMFGFEAPICCPPPTSTHPVPPPRPVKPLLINPLVRKVATCVCPYCPCYPPTPPPAPVAPPPTCIPPFSGAIYFYNGETNDGGGDHIEHIGGTLGYRTMGLLPNRCTPWSIDVDIDFISSVFDSQFLAFEYRRFLDQIGYVPGMAAHIKSSIGPVALVAEWNGALRNAVFNDDLGQAVGIQPEAWQVQLAYQFGWNPTVEVIGAQGTYFVVGYSESSDLAGVTRVLGVAPDQIQDRVGFVPEKRLSVGMGEWVLEGLRVAIEYAYLVDYAVVDGGTGNSANGVFMQLTYEW